MHIAWKCLSRMAPAILYLGSGEVYHRMIVQVWPRHGLGNAMNPFTVLYNTRCIFSFPAEMIGYRLFHKWCSSLWLECSKQDRGSKEDGDEVISIGRTKAPRTGANISTKGQLPMSKCWLQPVKSLASLPTCDLKIRIKSDRQDKKESGGGGRRNSVNFLKC